MMEPQVRPLKPWQEALGYISDKLKSIMESDGADSVGAIGSHRCSNEDNYMLSKFMRTVVGTNNLDSSAHFGYGKVQDAFKRGFGVKAPPLKLASPLGKDIILVLDSDPTITHPVFGLNLMSAQRQGSRLITADSKRSKLAGHSSQWLRMRPGASVALLNGMMKVIIEESLFDESAKNVQGFSDLEAALNDYTPDKVSTITGISAEEIAGLSRDFAKAESRLLTMDLGATENTKGFNTVLAAINLLVLLGEKPEALQIPAEFSNTLGLYKMGVRPDTGESPGKGIQEMLYEPGGLKALYIMGENPLVNFPDATKVMETLQALDLLVVQDIALTHTAKIAHVVLPAASWAEKDGTFINAEGLPQRFNKLVEAPGEALPDWQIIGELAQAMGQDAGADNLNALRQEIDSQPEDSPGEPKPVFNPVSYAPPESAGAGDFPLLMITRDLLQHSGSMSTMSNSLGLAVSDAFFEISKGDALKCGIADNSHIKVTSGKGSVYIKTRISDDVPEGVVYVPTHFPHANVDLLTSAPANGEAPIYTVKIESIGGS